MLGEQTKEMQKYDLEVPEHILQLFNTICHQHRISQSEKSASGHTQSSSNMKQSIQMLVILNEMAQKKVQKKQLFDLTHSQGIIKSLLDLQKIMPPDISVLQKRGILCQQLFRAVFQMRCCNPEVSLQILQKIESHLQKQEMIQGFVLCQYARITCQVMITGKIKRYLQKYKKLKEVYLKHQSFIQKAQSLYAFIESIKSIIYQAMNDIITNRTAQDTQQNLQIQYLNILYGLEIKKQKQKYQLWLQAKNKYRQYEYYYLKNYKCRLLSVLQVSQQIKDIILQQNKFFSFIHFFTINIQSVLFEKLSYQSLKQIKMSIFSVKAAYGFFKTKGARLLAQVRFPNLRRLIITQSKINDQDCYQLSKGDWPLLKTLNLENFSFSPAFHNIITSKGFSFLTKWTNLSRLNIECNKLGNIGCKIFARGQWKNLFELNLSSNGITEEGIRHLVKADMLNLKNLIILKQYDNQNANLINDTSFRLLTKAQWPLLNQLMIFKSSLQEHQCKKIMISSWKPKEAQLFFFYQRMRRQVRQMFQEAMQGRRQ